MPRALQPIETKRGVGAGSRHTAFSAQAHVVHLYLRNAGSRGRERAVLIAVVAFLSRRRRRFASQPGEDAS
jgi:hypothetical protein